MVFQGADADNGVMNRLLAPPNGAHLVVAAIALFARLLLGGIPLIGGVIGFVLLLVALYHLARVAMNVIRTSPSQT